jgi:hypothetical protein
MSTMKDEIFYLKIIFLNFSKLLFFSYFQMPSCGEGSMDSGSELGKAGDNSM